MTLEYRLTSIKDIPKNWDVEKIENVILEAKAGFASGKRDETGVIQLRMNSIDTQGWINSDGYVKVPIPKDVKEYLLKKGDVLFNNTNSAKLVGKTAIFNGEIPECVYSNHLTRLRVNPRKVIPEWLSLVFMRYWQRGIFKALRHQHVHQAGINQGDLLNVKIPVPNLEEQRKIVDIFLCVDDSIQKVDDAIAKTERLKKGLLQKLLTEGIGHKEFKETKIGKIPKTWQVKSLKEVAEVSNGYVFPPRFQGKKKRKYLFAKVNDFNLHGNEKYIKTTDNTVDNEDISKIRVRIFPSGTIIFPQRGAAIYLNRKRILAKEGVFDNNLMGITPLDKTLQTEFLYYYFVGKINLKNISSATTTPQITKTTVEPIKIAIPLPKEQLKIAEILSMIDNKLRLEKRRKEKLERIKRGLMNDLLTGRRRVKVGM